MSPERRADEMMPVAAALAIAVDQEEAEEVETILTTLSRNQLYALAVVLAAHVDPDRPFTRATVAAVTKRAAHRVAAFLDVEVSDIFSPSQRREICDARLVTYYAAHLAGDTYSQIGRILNRDHTTVITGIARVGEKRLLREIAQTVAAELGWERGQETA